MTRTERLQRIIRSLEDPEADPTLALDELRRSATEFEFHLAVVRAIQINGLSECVFLSILDSVHHPDTVRALFGRLAQDPRPSVQRNLASLRTRLRQRGLDPDEPGLAPADAGSPPSPLVPLTASSGEGAPKTTPSHEDPGESCVVVRIPGSLVWPAPAEPLPRRPAPCDEPMAERAGRSSRQRPGCINARPPPTWEVRAPANALLLCVLASGALSSLLSLLWSALLSG